MPTLDTSSFWEENKVRRNTVKEKLARGEAQFGTMILDLHGPGLAQIMENAGADFIMYDMEAACMDIGLIKNQLSMCRGLKIIPFVNVASQDPVMMQLALDSGALGIMIPVVETRAQAQAIADITHYPPKGRRGVAFGIAHDDYSMGELAKNIKDADKRNMIIPKIESAAGVEAIDEILSVPGIDAAFVGHMDLSVSLGTPGDYDNPKFNAAVDKVIAACKRHKKPGVCLVGSTEAGKKWMKKGFRMVMYSTDTMLIAGAYRAGLAELKA
jgi:2-keto-3-deoxy-L-rhamnonate aldolase RhmA